MEPYRADRVVRVLGGLATFLYYAAWVALILAIVAIPVIRFASTNPELSFDVPVHVAAPADLVAHWNGREWPLALQETRGDLEVPIAAAPLGAFAVLWVGWVTAAALLVRLLHHLRRVFQRVRAGAPFDPENARHLRAVGLLLIAFAVLDGVLDFWAANAVLRAVAAGREHIGTSLTIDSRLLIGLVVIVLAEIFRRGAALEEEQALVV